MSVTVASKENLPDCKIQTGDSGMVHVETKWSGATAEVQIDLSTNRKDPLMQVRYEPDEGEVEMLLAR